MLFGPAHTIEQSTRRLSNISNQVAPIAAGVASYIHRCSTVRSCDRWEWSGDSVEPRPVHIMMVPFFSPDPW